MEFEGKILIVTGAAGGIGLATARELAGLGARLVVTDVDGARLERELGEIAAACEPGDLTDADARARVVARAVELGGLDGLVCCHGIAGMAPDPRVPARALAAPARRQLDLGLLPLPGRGTRTSATAAAS